MPPTQALRQAFDIRSILEYLHLSPRVYVDDVALLGLNLINGEFLDYVFGQSRQIGLYNFYARPGIARKIASQVIQYQLSKCSIRVKQLAKIADVGQKVNVFFPLVPLNQFISGIAQHIVE